jgi:hypothetical protein
MALDLMSGFDGVGLLADADANIAKRQITSTYLRKFCDDHFTAYPELKA